MDTDIEKGIEFEKWWEEKANGVFKDFGINNSIKTMCFSAYYKGMHDGLKRTMEDRYGN